jgi:hypothetical protein
MAACRFSSTAEKAKSGEASAPLGVDTVHIFLVAIRCTSNPFGKENFRVLRLFKRTPPIIPSLQFVLIMLALFFHPVMRANAQESDVDVVRLMKSLPLKQEYRDAGAVIFLEPPRCCPPPAPCPEEDGFGG